MSVSLAVYGLYANFYLFGPLTDDEPYYFRQVARFTSILNDLLRGEFVRIPDVLHQIVENGWFIPAVSAVLAPAGIFGDSVPYLRSVHFVINFALHALIVWQIFRLFGSGVAILFHGLSLLFPPNIIFMFSLVGEGIASRVLLVLLLYLCGLIRQVRVLSWPQVCAIGVLTALMCLLRSNLLVLTPLVALTVALIVGRQRSEAGLDVVKPAMGRVALVTVIVILAFAPWSLALSKKFDGPYFNTTSMHVGFIWHNATPEFEAERLENTTLRDHHNPFWKWMLYYQGQSRKTGEGFYDLVERDVQILKGLLPPGHARQRTLRKGWKRLALNSRFVEQRFDGSGEGTIGSESTAAIVKETLRWFTKILWQPMVVLSFLAVVAYRDGTRFTLAVVGLLGSANLLIFASFVLAGLHTRHHAVVYPLVSLLSVLTLLGTWRYMQRVAGKAPGASDDLERTPPHRVSFR